VAQPQIESGALELGNSGCHARGGSVSGARFAPGHTVRRCNEPGSYNARRRLRTLAVF
jgi:hypothetical protein